MAKCTRFHNWKKSNYPGAVYELTCMDCGEGKLYYSSLITIIGKDIKECN